MDSSGARALDLCKKSPVFESGLGGGYKGVQFFMGSGGGQGSSLSSAVQVLIAERKKVGWLPTQSWGLNFIFIRFV